VEAVSDGISDANRNGRLALDIELAAARLADALEECRDAAFGIPQSALDVANERLRLHHVGVKLVFDEKRRT